MQATNAAGALYVVGGSTSGFTPTNRVERYESPCTTPTATVTGTPPTATSTVTPTLTPCGEAIANGGFETGDLTNWAIRDSVPAPTVRAGTAHSGTYAAFLGSDPGTEPTGDSSIYQQITVPASGGTLSYWYYPYSEDSITFDWQDAYVTDTSGTILATIMHVCETTQTWTQVTYDMSAFAGQTVQIEFLVHQDRLRRRDQHVRRRRQPAQHLLRLRHPQPGGHQHAGADRDLCAAAALRRRGPDARIRPGPQARQRAGQPDQPCRRRAGRRAAPVRPHQLRAR